MCHPDAGHRAPLSLVSLRGDVDLVCHPDASHRDVPSPLALGLGSRTPSTWLVSRRQSRVRVVLWSEFYPAVSKEPTHVVQKGPQVDISTKRDEGERSTVVLDQ